MNKQQQFQNLQKILAMPPGQPYRWQSRVHPLRTFSGDNVKCFIKRDDELSFSISGSKIRKYLSLIPQMIQKGVKQLIPGALTLPLDIVRNEIESGFTFDHLFVESGTGLQAIALILGLQAINHPSIVHVVLLADKAETFEEKLLTLSKAFDIAVVRKNYQLHYPKVAPSFGSVNQEVINTISSFAKGEGLFLDPVYSAKLFYTGREILQSNSLTGNILFIHSGGALSLSGFQDRFH